MHTSVIQSPQAMSNDQSYRPRSPDLPGLAESHSQRQQQPPRLSRLPSYQIQEPTLPRGYSFSPRGSYDASPFFSQLPQHSSSSDFSVQLGNSYPEQSPPRFTPVSLPDQPQVFNPISYTESPQRYQNAKTVQNPPLQFSQLQIQSPQSYHPTIDDMARLRSRKPVNYSEDHDGGQYEEPVPIFPQSQTMHQIPQPQQPQQPPHLSQHPPSNQFMQQPMSFAQPPQAMVQQPFLPNASQMPQIDVKTKFPVARIKRIMQADEDVGKVAQATPTAVSKALELFMIALVTKGAAEAKNNNSKRVTATHLKHALLTDPQFDFLNEICEAVPDEGGKGSKGRAKSEAKSEESDEDMGVALKKKVKASRKKKGAEEEGSD